MARKRSKLKAKQLNFVASTECERPASFFEGKTAEQLIQEAYEEIDRLGYHIVRRKLIKPTTTMLITIFLGEGFDDYHPIQQAAVLWHEIRSDIVNPDCNVERTILA